LGMRARGIRKVTRQVRWPRDRGISYRKRKPFVPEMSKAALREMLRCAVENTL
jgi:hypothetical protein